MEHPSVPYHSVHGTPLRLMGPPGPRGLLKITPGAPGVSSHWLHASTLPKVVCFDPTMVRTLLAAKGPLLRRPPGDF